MLGLEESGAQKRPASGTPPVSPCQDSESGSVLGTASRLRAIGLGDLGVQGLRFRSA